jgi:Uncharacterized protein involved in tellurite resistance
MDPFKEADDSNDSLILQPEEAAAAKPKDSEVLTTFKDQFSESDLKSIHEIKDKIEPLNNDALITYGANAQQAMSKFSHQMLSEVQSKDVGPIGETLEELMKN